MGLLALSRAVMVMCNGMGRGGSTLQYNLTRRLVERGGAGGAHGYMVDGSTHAQQVPVPYTHPTLPTKRIV